MDLGIAAFATLSDGTRIFHPGWYRRAERALKTAQRRMSWRKKGGIVTLPMPKGTGLRAGASSLPGVRRTDWGPRLPAP